MRIHILGICGTFMGGIAALAKALGHEVEGSDVDVYPPMSTQLEALGIRLFQGYKPEHLKPAPDVVVVGNALSRGNPALEHVLAEGIAYQSGPQWLYEQLLRNRHVIAIAGTHGKTTTTSMTAWILEQAGLKPGFLIGGVAPDFGVSARLGEGRHFVVEADEYDTAFFDKGSKFLHYRPRTLVLNNLEYDHADIFPDLAAIETQFHYLLRSVPGNGLIVVNGADAALARVIARGCWTPRQSFGTPEADWQASDARTDGSAFGVLYKGKTVARVEWKLLGAHNVNNALAAMAAAQHAGVTPERAAAALATFQGVKRRLEVRAKVDGVTVYDDFAHHPTAVATTLAGLRARVGKERILAVMEPRSATMKMGVHRDTLAGSLKDADRVFVYQAPNVKWDVAGTFASLGTRASVIQDIGALTDAVMAEVQRGDHILIMSNGGFGGFHEKLIDRLERNAAPRC
ncbi:MAG TPA: UDP-N-acetylmuramate:L-alanyl-gamma-D-glutamyl-meso-diaminopimelate ligase [Gammaproteobacteria bacterium]|jgi:UDP-N-acetylmuramate: L-alanyl-gamma-D-glutamyl-meso-diaminopimelate ligase|nr:UDP-N-acetylmuramate:L-alanyl-gamma-D-glutamyl-meso-diaminopimelate ligase [Gammaproteobacteria bacterium]